MTARRRDTRDYTLVARSAVKSRVRQGDENLDQAVEDRTGPTSIFRRTVSLGLNRAHASPGSLFLP